MSFKLNHAIFCVQDEFAARTDTECGLAQAAHPPAQQVALLHCLCTLDDDSDQA